MGELNPYLAARLNQVTAPITLLIEVEPNRGDDVKRSLAGLGLTISAQSFNFLTVPNVPVDKIDAIKSVPGVTMVHLDKRVGIVQFPFLGGDFGIDGIVAPRELLGPDLLLPFSPIRILRRSNYNFIPSSVTRKLVIDKETDLDGSGVKVAVLDTGSPVLHPMAPFVKPFSASAEIQPFDGIGHSTWCLTEIGGSPWPTIYGQCAGIAPKVDLYSIKVLSTLGMGCLTSRDWVLTTEGYRYASMIKPNDLLINYNCLKGVFEVDKAVKTFKRQMKDGEKLMRIKTDEGHVILLTESHPVLTQKGLWKRADKLEPLDHVFSDPNISLAYMKPPSYPSQPKRTATLRDRLRDKTLFRPCLDETVFAGAIPIAKEVADMLVANVPVDPVIVDVKAVRPQPRKGKIVYDIETEKNGTLVVNGIIVHNSTSEVLAGMELAGKLGVKIVSMSLGSEATGGCETDPICKAVQILEEQGILVIVASGNSGPSPKTVGSPGISPHAITVGSVSVMDNDEVSYFSSRGPTEDGLTKPDVSSYGGGRASKDAFPDELIVSGCDGWLEGIYDGLIDRFGGLHGTSMSAPTFAGLMALVEQDRNRKGSSLRLSEVMSILAEKGTEKSNDSGFGVARASWFI